VVTKYKQDVHWRTVRTVPTFIRGLRCRWRSKSCMWNVMHCCLVNRLQDLENKIIRIFRNVGNNLPVDTT